MAKKKFTKELYKRPLQRKDVYKSFRMSEEQANKVQATCLEMRIDMSTFIRGALLDVCNKIQSGEMDPYDFYKMSKDLEK